MNKKTLKFKKLSRTELKNVSGGEGKCKPVLWEIVWDPNCIDEDGWQGCNVLVRTPGTC